MKLIFVMLLAASLHAHAGVSVTDIPQSPDLTRIYLIYLHGRIIEDAGPRPTHPQFGLYDYPAVVDALSSRGAAVISVQRAAKTDPDKYAGVVASQIDSLLAEGVPAKNIIVVSRNINYYR